MFIIVSLWSETLDSIKNHVQCIWKMKKYSKLASIKRWKDLNMDFRSTDSNPNPGLTNNMISMTPQLDKSANFFKISSNKNFIHDKCTCWLTLFSTYFIVLFSYNKALQSQINSHYESHTYLPNSLLFSVFFTILFVIVYIPHFSLF